MVHQLACSLYRYECKCVLLSHIITSLFKIAVGIGIILISTQRGKRQKASVENY